MSDLWGEWREKQRTCEELYSEELPESYKYWAKILTKTFSEFCIVEGSILDVGCGNPDDSIKYFGGEGFYYIGLDPFALVPTSVIPIVKGLGEDLPFASESFDNVALMSVLDHVVDPTIFVSEVCRVVRVGGCLYIMILVWTDNFGVENDEFHFKHFKEGEIYALIPDNFTVEATQFIPYKEEYRRVMYLKARKIGHENPSA
jgi:SAM-dependent methyltransferase